MQINDDRCRFLSVTRSPPLPITTQVGPASHVHTAACPSLYYFPPPLDGARFTPPQKMFHIQPFSHECKMNEWMSSLQTHAAVKPSRHSSTKQCRPEKKMGMLQKPGPFVNKAGELKHCPSSTSKTGSGIASAATKIPTASKPDKNGSGRSLTASCDLQPPFQKSLNAVKRISWTRVLNNIRCQGWDLFPFP